jgi:CRP-like cAMP-binding protein
MQQEQEHARLKTGLEFRQRLHDRGNLSDAVPVLMDGEVDPQFAMRSILALQRGPIHYHRNKMIFIEGDPAEYIFLLIDGVVRSCRSFSDGNRSIVCFYIAGELFGFNGELTHSLSAEAATNTTMLLLKRSAVLAMMARDGRIANFLLANTTKELRRLQEHAVLISRNAQCRVATFLIDLSMRTGTTEYLIFPCLTATLQIILGSKLKP